MKAGEVKISFNFRDITEEKSYFNGMSLEQIVHSMSTEADEEIPLVKHITTRWSTRDKKMELELTVTSALVDEATKRLKTLRNDLMKKYGNEVRSHFIENGNKEARAWKTTPMKRKLPEITTNWDEDVEAFLDERNTEDKILRVLIEGMEQLTNKDQETQQKNTDQEPGNRKGKEVEDQKEATNKNGKTSTEEDDIIEIDSDDGTDEEMGSGGVVTELSDSDSYIQHVAWDEISIVGEFNNCTPATQEQRRKVFNTLHKQEIELADIEKWKNKEWVKLGTIVEESNHKEYSVMKRIVQAIREDKEKNEKKDARTSRGTQESEIKDKNGYNKSKEKRKKSSGSSQPNKNEKSPTKKSEVEGQEA